MEKGRKTEVAYSYRWLLFAAVGQVSVVVPEVAISVLGAQEVQPLAACWEWLWLNWDAEGAFALQEFQIRVHA